MSLVLALFAASLDAGDGTIRRGSNPQANSYIVVLNDDIIDEVEIITDELSKKHGGRRVHLYKHTIKGGAFSMTPQQAAAMSRDPRVAFVEEDSAIIPAATVTPRSWNLDRMDNRINPRLDSSFTYCSTGRGVRAYLIDSGIWAGHDEFSNPDPISGGPRVVLGWDFRNWQNPEHQPNLSNNPCPRDANNMGGSHGTAVASVLGGRTLGAAPEVTLVPVLYADCTGFGFQSNAIAGLDWIPTDAGYAGRGRVVNLSWVINAEGTATGTTGVELSIQALLNQGITVVGAAGNQRDEIGMRYSPARMSSIITVGGTKGGLASAADARWDDGPQLNPGSNYGSVIDLFAPADRVLVAHWTTTTSTRDQANNTQSSGTSFAAPLVAGAAARILEFYPTETGQQIASRLIADATSDVHGLNILGRNDSPNRLLYMYSNCKRRACC